MSYGPNTAVFLRKSHLKVCKEVKGSMLICVYNIYNIIIVYVYPFAMFVLHKKKMANMYYKNQISHASKEIKN